jgi:bacillithiol system protein YtxJ
MERQLIGIQKNQAKFMLNWNSLTSKTQLEELVNRSANSTFAIFKHSTRCSISSMAKNRLERSWDQAINPPLYLLDLLNHRNLSNQIAEQFDVQHESPQLLIIQKGKCINHQSHNEISMDILLK